MKFPLLDIDDKYQSAGHTFSRRVRKKKSHVVCHPPIASHYD